MHYFLLCASHFWLNAFWLLLLHLYKPSLQKCEKQLLASACLSTWNNMAPTGGIFIKVCIWVFFENLSRKLKFHWSWIKITGILHEDQYTFFIISCSFSTELEVFPDKFLDKLKTHLVNFFLISCHLWGNLERGIRATQPTDDNMVHALCMMDTLVYKRMLRISYIYCLYTATMVARTHLNVTLYLRCLSCFLQEYNFLFMPTFTGMKLGCKARTRILVSSVNEKFER